MSNIMIIGKGKAIIQYDAELEMFRGEFINLNKGSADFYADNIEQLKVEGKISLDMFTQACKEDGVEAFKHYSGKFNVRITPEHHEKAVLQAQEQGLSLNSLVGNAIEEYIQNH